MPVTLSNIACPVIAMRPPSGEPMCMVGAVEHPLLGHKVAVGAACSLAGAPGLSLVAHLDPETALQLAAQIMEAAATVSERLNR